MRHYRAFAAFGSIADCGQLLSARFGAMGLVPRAPKPMEWFRFSTDITSSLATAPKNLARPCCASLEWAHHRPRPRRSETHSLAQPSIWRWIGRWPLCGAGAQCNHHSPRRFRRAADHGRLEPRELWSAGRHKWPLCSARTAANEAFDSGHRSIPVVPASTLMHRQGMQAATCRLTTSSTSRPHVIRNALREYTMGNSVPGSQGGGS